MENKSFNLNQVTARLQVTLKNTPTIIGNDAVNYFLDRFKNANWEGVPWEIRKPTKRINGKPLLVKTRRLYRSIKVTKISGLTVTIGSDVPYAKAHNEGFKGEVNVKEHRRVSWSKHKIDSNKLTKKGAKRSISISRLEGISTVKAHTRKMNLPKRQFMGYSPILMEQIKKRLTADINHALNNQ